MRQPRLKTVTKSPCHVQRATRGLYTAMCLDFDVVTSRIDAMPEIPLKVMMNVGNPDRAFDFARLPHAGVGLARLEFIINRMIGVHPKALLDFDESA